MLMEKKNIESFYKELKTNVSKIDDLNIWQEYDWSENNGIENSAIMTELAREISKWNPKTDYGDFSAFFQTIEDGFLNFDKTTSSYLATDFLVTIMEIKDKFIRDEIKKFMRNETQKQYREMLHFYREL